jgi:capsular exopolysaccharide synthesis family protein
VNDRLAVLTSGPLPPNPTELLASNKMKAILASMADRFDIIVIDSPPLLVLADASLWASLADAIVIVARQGKTRRGAFNEALTTAKASHKPIIGVVINAVHRKKDDDYYYRYGYGYRSRDKANS